MHFSPSVSFIIPVYNSERVLPQCLAAIQEQDYPMERVEIIIADGGSTDNTLQIAREFGVHQILPNPLKTGEAGKAVGARAARHEILAFVDSDNYLEGSQWLNRMVAAFQDPDIVASEPLFYTYRREDPSITRYCALMGMNDPFCYFIGNYDRYNAITGKWTELPIEQEDRGDYLKLELGDSMLPTIGANGFLIRREVLLAATFEPYLFDIDILSELAHNSPVSMAKVKIGIIHFFADSFRAVLRKQHRRIEDYLYYRHQGMRRYTWNRIPRSKLLLFIGATLTVFPLIVDVLRGFRKKPDSAWWWHVPMCWATLGIYSWGVVQGIISPPQNIKDRSDWQGT